MKSWVLDASVAAKWFLPPAQETLTNEAQRLLEDFAGGRVRLLAPDLFWSEFGNVLWKAVRLGRISRATAEEALTTLEAVKITTSPATSAGASTTARMSRSRSPRIQRC